MTSPFSEPPPRRSRSPFCALALVLASAGCGGAPADATGKPNVLLISIDTLRADHLGFYGYGRPTSPRLDAFAASATVFDSAHASSSWTLPTMASVFTSTYSSTHKLWGYNGRLDSSFTTLTEVLTARGYDTACVVSHIYCTTRHGLQQGFVHFDDAYAFPEEDADETVTSHIIADKGIRFLEQKERAPDGKPWFLWLHFFDPHASYREHEGFSEAFVTPGERSPTQTEIDLYDGEIAFTDHHVGRVLETLGATGFDQDTIVVLVADHGEEFKDHGSGDQHGHSLFAELVRVPLVVRAPGVPPRRVAQPVRTIDILPTVLELADLGQLAQADGESLGARMRGEDVANAPALAEVRLSRANEWEAVVDGRYKFVRRRMREGVEREIKLFDLEDDPGERQNLALERNDEVARLEAVLDGLLEAARAKGERYGSGTTALGPDAIDALGKLGYADGEQPR